jgi:hypothetical protein
MPSSALWAPLPPTGFRANPQGSRWWCHLLQQAGISAKAGLSSQPQINHIETFSGEVMVYILRDSEYPQNEQIMNILVRQWVFLDFLDF